MLLLISGTAYAKNNVSEIDISVTVRDDGSAYVVQNWQGTFEEGTENYIPIATKAVSYTHLDVYKRQRYRRSDRTLYTKGYAGCCFRKRSLGASDFNENHR